MSSERMWWELVLLSPMVDDNVGNVALALAVGEVGEVEEPDDVADAFDDVEGAGAPAGLLNLLL